MEYEREIWINELINELNHDNKEGTLWKDIKEYLEALQWNQGDTEDFIGDLLEDGTIYEPRLGRIKLTLDLDQTHSRVEIRDFMTYARLKILEMRERKINDAFDLRIWNISPRILSELTGICDDHGINRYTTYKRD